jgi:hypothetical protein
MKKDIKNYIVISSYKGKPQEQLKILGELMSERFGVKGCKIVTETPSTADVRGKTIIGSLVSSYLGIAASEVIEVNTSGFFSVPARMVGKLTEEEKGELLTYAKSYRVTATDVKLHEPKEAKEAVPSM